MNGGLRWVLLAGIALAFARAALPGLSDPSEGRYAQVSWEMAESGDWLVPRWNGIAHLEKPPLAYWAGAAGIRIFGRNEFGARFLPVVALALTALLTAGIARRTGGSPTAGAAALLLAPFPLAVGGALLTDVFVLLAAALFFDAVLRRLDGEGRAVWDRAAIGLAIGFLAKGHVVLLFTVLPLLAARTGLSRELVRLRPMLLFLGLTVPWFLLVALRYREFIAVHGAKFLDFVSGGGEHHEAPFPIYVVALAAGLFPLIAWARPGILAIERARRRLLLCWLLLPLAVLTLLPSRQFTYILPAVPAVAAAAARGITLEGYRWARLASAFGALAAGIGLAAAPFLARSGFAAEAGAVLFCASGALLVGAALLGLPGRIRPLPAASAAAALLSASYVVASLVDETPFKIHRRAARAAMDLAGSDREVVVAGFKVPSIPFYFGRRVLVAGLEDRLAAQARLWGGSAWFRPEIDIVDLVRTDFDRVILVAEDWRLRTTPERIPARVFGNVAILFGKPPP